MTIENFSRALEWFGPFTLDRQFMDNVQDTISISGFFGDISSQEAEQIMAGKKAVRALLLSLRACGRLWPAKVGALTGVCPTYLPCTGPVHGQVQHAAARFLHHHRHVRRERAEALPHQAQGRLGLPLGQCGVPISPEAHQGQPEGALPEGTTSGPPLLISPFTFLSSTCSFFFMLKHSDVFTTVMIFIL